MGRAELKRLTVERFKSYAEPAADEYGLDQLNVVRWGAPHEEGAVGALHHVPRRTEHRLKKGTGWSC